MRLQSTRFGTISHSGPVNRMLAVSLLLFRVAAFGQEIQLIHLSKLSPTADSLPRIAHPTPAQTRINRSLAHIDQVARGQVRLCRGRSEQGYPMSYDRTISILAHGARFFAFDSFEQFDCGGVHPYIFGYSLTFDLQTGEQVKWSNYLTKVKAEDLGSESDKGILIQGVTSPLLAELYAKGYGKDGQCDVEVVLQTASMYAGSPQFLLSPAPKKKGLDITAFDPVPNESTCFNTVTLGKSSMDSLGIPPKIQAELLAQP